MRPFWPKGQWTAVGYDDLTVRIASTASGKEGKHFTVTPHAERKERGFNLFGTVETPQMDRVMLSPTQRWILTNDGYCNKLWNSTSGKEVCELEQPGAELIDSTPAPPAPESAGRPR